MSLLNLAAWWRPHGFPIERVLVRAKYCVLMMAIGDSPVVTGCVTGCVNGFILSMCDVLIMAIYLFTSYAKCCTSTASPLFGVSPSGFGDRNSLPETPNTQLRHCLRTLSTYSTFSGSGPKRKNRVTTNIPSVCQPARIVAAKMVHLSRCARQWHLSRAARSANDNDHFRT